MGSKLSHPWLFLPAIFQLGASLRHFQQEELAETAFIWMIVDGVARVESVDELDRVSIHNNDFSVIDCADAFAAILPKTKSLWSLPCANNHIGFLLANHFQKDFVGCAHF